MSTKEYRKQIEQSIAKALRDTFEVNRFANRSRSISAAWSPTRRAAAKTRAEALGRLMRVEGPDVIPETALQRLADPKESPVVRLAALRLLQQKQIFSSVAAEWRPAYHRGLEDGSR